MIVKPQTYTFGHTSDDALPLRCGRKLGPVSIAYETWGSLNSEASNAILVCHALTGSAHAAGKYHESDKKPGWWDEMIGPGKAFDTDRYFIVCSNVLGSCYGSTGPTSINPATGKAYAMSFPVITVADMVNAQVRLADFLGVKKWLSVVGGSLGGMQALQWAVAYPERVHSCLPIATTARLSPQAIGWDWVGREAILSDPKFLGGEYTKEAPPERGLAVARMLAHITYLSDASMNEKFGRRLQQMSDVNYSFDLNYQVESYLNHQGLSFVGRYDANAYLYITRATDYFDLASEGGGDLTAALAKSRCAFGIISFSSDWLFTPAQSEELVASLLRLKREVFHCDIQSDYGHDAFLLEVETLGSLVRGFLSNQQRSFGNG
jgi:homoserine O-acetyltransferase